MFGSSSALKGTFERLGVELDGFKVSQVLESVERAIIEEELRSNEMKAVQVAVVDEARGVQSPGLVRFDDHRAHGIVGEFVVGDHVDHLGELCQADFAVEVNLVRGITSRSEACATKTRSRVESHCLSYLRPLIRRYLYC